MKLPELKIKNKKSPTPIVQGGMGVGISLAPLASAVSREGGTGVISSAALDRLVSKRINKSVNSYEAAYAEVSEAKSASNGGLIGINIMCALTKDYSESVKGALDAEVDFIISGAGLPLGLPLIQNPKSTALIPIVSSARALTLLCQKWEKRGYRPDAAVLEGPLAGGHLGFKFDEIDLESSRLSNLFPSVKEVAIKYGDFPVIVAGGIYLHDDIIAALKMGADGVQMGTRFLATEESGATKSFKQAVVACEKEDVVVADFKKNPPGSPCHLPFRVIRQSPAFANGLREMVCQKGYVLQKDTKGNFSLCPARHDCANYFCICESLLASCGYVCRPEKELWTVGINACRVKKILSVRELMQELKGA